jgi:ammonium transporter, Amt family
LNAAGTWSNDGWASPALPKNEALFGVGLIDFAGCYPVHMMGGICALAGAKIVGPRIGKYGKDGEINELPGHNASFGMLGVFLLWFQWYDSLY